MRDVFAQTVKHNTLARIAVGAGVVYAVMTIIVFGYNQVTELFDANAERNARSTEERLVAAPPSDYFLYTDIRTKKHTYTVGEPITFQSTRSYNGNYPINYIDRIICPDEPRRLVEVASSTGFTVDTDGEQQTVDWTFGDYNQGEPFEPKVIDQPQDGCISEHLIAVEVAPDLLKTQLLINRTKFRVVGGS